MMDRQQILMSMKTMILALLEALLGERMNSITSFFSGKLDWQALFKCIDDYNQLEPSTADGD